MVCFLGGSNFVFIYLFIIFYFLFKIFLCFLFYTRVGGAGDSYLDRHHQFIIIIFNCGFDHDLTSA